LAVGSKFKPITMVLFETVRHLAPTADVTWQRSLEDHPFAAPVGD